MVGESRTLLSLGFDVKTSPRRHTSLFLFFFFFFISPRTSYLSPNNDKILWERTGVKAACHHASYLIPSSNPIISIPVLPLIAHYITLLTLFSIFFQSAQPSVQPCTIPPTPVPSQPLPYRLRPVYVPSVCIEPKYVMSAMHPSDCRQELQYPSPICTSWPRITLPPRIPWRRCEPYLLSWPLARHFPMVAFTKPPCVTSFINTWVFSRPFVPLTIERTSGTYNL